VKDSNIPVDQLALVRSVGPDTSVLSDQYFPSPHRRAVVSTHLFSKDKYLYPSEPFLLSSIFPKNGTPGQPPMGHFE
jgi:hypothetical protein